MSNQNTDGWMEYSRLVLKELSSLSSDMKKLQEQIHDLKSELIELKAERNKVVEVLDWKSRIDEIASPTQLAALKSDVEQLKMFKTKAVTIFMVVQVIMGIAISLSKLV